MSGELKRHKGLAYRRQDGAGPTTVWFCGFRSDMGGTKAESLAEAAAASGQAYLRFDYFAHGDSAGDWAEARVSRWQEDSLCIVDDLTEGPLVLVGSSMGGGMALHVALTRPERVRALVLIAPAPDFLTALVEPDLSPEARRALAASGVHMLDGVTPLSQAMFDDARAHQVLPDLARIACPVRILHGCADEVVPEAFVRDLVDRLGSEDVRLTLIKGGDHRLSRPDDLQLLAGTVAEARG